LAYMVQANAIATSAQRKIFVIAFIFLWVLTKQIARCVPSKINQAGF
jgi:hypothetical protein